MILSKQISRSLNRISAGAKQIVGGTIGVVRSLDVLLLDIRFWAEGKHWDVPFETVKGKKGQCKTVNVSPGCLFRGEKLMATDTAAEPGTGTRITAVLVGQRTQRPIGGGTLTLFFGTQALGNGLDWDLCQPNESISITVEFLRDCTWTANVFGRALF